MDKMESLSWIINSSCNLRCIHCYPDSGESCEIDRDINLLEKNLNTIRFNNIYISGGEPLLSSNLIKYVQIAKRLANYEVGICTNGTLLDSSMASKLCDAGITKITISIQHTENNTLSAQIYGKDNVIRKIINAISVAKMHKLPVTLEMTLMNLNYEYVDNLFEMAQSCGVDSLFFKRFRKVGRGKENFDLALSNEENYNILNRIHELSLEQKDIKVSVHDPLYKTVMFDYYFSQGYSIKQISDLLPDTKGCNAGINWIGLDFVGNISPCPLMIYENVIIGNVYQQSLYDIINNSAIIKALTLNHEKEAQCKYARICRGCRVSALVETGCLYAKDPMCTFNNFECPSEITS